MARFLDRSSSLLGIGGARRCRQHCQLHQVSNTLTYMRSDSSSSGVDHWLLVTFVIYIKSLSYHSI